MKKKERDAHIDSMICLAIDFETALENIKIADSKEDREELEDA